MVSLTNFSQVSTADIFSRCLGVLGLIVKGDSKVFLDVFFMKIWSKFLRFKALIFAQLSNFEELLNLFSRMLFKFFRTNVKILKEFESDNNIFSKTLVCFEKLCFRVKC